MTMTSARDAAPHGGPTRRQLLGGFGLAVTAGTVLAPDAQSEDGEAVGGPLPLFAVVESVDRSGTLVIRPPRGEARILRLRSGGVAYRDEGVAELSDFAAGDEVSVLGSDDGNGPFVAHEVDAVQRVVENARIVAIDGRRVETSAGVLRLRKSTLFESASGVTKLLDVGKLAVGQRISARGRYAAASGEIVALRLSTTAG